MTTTVETATGATKTMVLNMGPQHPSTHGVLRILLELDGETVVKAVPDIGYLHTGIEKSCEDKTYSQVTTLTDRITSTRLATILFMLWRWKNFSDSKSPSALSTSV